MPVLETTTLYWSNAAVCTDTGLLVLFRICLGNDANNAAAEQDVCRHLAHFCIVSFERLALNLR